MKGMSAEVGALWRRSTGRSRPALGPAAAEPEQRAEGTRGPLI